MFQNVLMIQRETNFILFFNVFWNLCILSKNKFECLRVISYKWKYVLFDLDMLKLFQKIDILFYFEIKLIFNKNFSLKYLIQGCNPHLLSWFIVHAP